MDIPTPKTKEEEKQEYLEDVHTLHRAKVYLEKEFGEDAALDYMIAETIKYVTEGAFSKHCYEYANKEPKQLTEAEMADILPKTWDGKPIFSYKDL